MTNAPAVLRTFIIYVVCVVLAIVLGFMLAGPLTYSSLGIYGLVAFVLVFPLLLRWHYPLLLLSWNMAAVVIFLPGRPSLYLLMVAISLGISVFQRMMSKQSQFISVPQLILPLLCVIGVIAFTAKLTGFGLHAFGSGIYGGRKYFFLIGGILGYFALSALRIPPERRNLYLKLFFLGGVTAVIGDLLPILPHSLYFIYWFFNFNTYAFSSGGMAGEGMRLHGAVIVATCVLSYMLIRYGMRGIFLSRKPWRWLIFFLFSVYGLFGGFRGFIVILGLLLTIQFFLEGLHRTRLLPIFVFSGMLGAIALIPLSSHLPYTFQRALTIVPLPYKLSEAARLDAQDSSDWRLRMWRAILPQVPEYLLLGKGYVISPEDYDFVMGPEASIHSYFAQNNPLALAEDFHSGPLSIVIPFGIWGCLAFLWFLGAGIRVTYLNYRYGDPSLQTINTFLFAAFLMHAIYFVIIYGAFSQDMRTFCGLLGLSVAFNGGVARRVRAVQPVREIHSPRRVVPMRPSPAPAFQRRLPGPNQ